MQEQTDRELVTLARVGDKEAFGELLARYQPMALRIAHGMVRQEEVAHAGIILPEGKTPELHYAEQLLKHAGITLPEGKKLRLGYSKNPARDAVVKEIKATLSGIPQPPGEKEFEQARKNYLTFVLGDDFER